MKPKLNLSKDGVKDFFINHVEKIVFGIAALTVVIFIYFGYGLESYPSNKTPDALKKLGAQAVAHINEPSSKALLEQRKPREGRGGQYDSRVQESRAATDATAYAITVPWDPPVGAPGTKREDPAIYPPIKLETTALTAAICLQADSGSEGPLAKLENAPLPDSKKSRRPRSKPKRRSGGGAGGMMSGPMSMSDDGSGAGDAGMMSGPGGMMSGPGADTGGGRGRGSRDKNNKQTVTRRYPADKVCGYRPGGQSTGAGMGMGMDMGMSGMESAGSMDDSAMASGAMSGMASGGGAAMGGGRAGTTGGVVGQGPARAESRQFVIVKALAPYRKQADEFKHVLGNAVGYDPTRDQPRIIFFQAQRADVTDNPDQVPDEAKWKSIMNPKTAAHIMKSEKWHGTMAEIADPMYVDPNVTMPIPPIMLRCIEKELLHTDVPKATSMTSRAVSSGTSEEGDSKDPGEKPDSDLPGGGGMAGAGMMNPGGMAGGGMMSPAGGMMGSGTMEPGAGMMGSSMMGSSMMGSSMMGSSMMGSSMMGSSMGRLGNAEPVQYKLIRFFDMSVKPGRVYRYRIRLFVEDPNNPNSDPENGLVFSPPRRRTLSANVLKRLSTQKTDERMKKAYYVISDWSEATDPVTLPSPSHLYVSDVTPQRYATGVNNALIPQSEPRAHVCPVGWNERLAIDVSAEHRAWRGSFMKFRDNFEVLDPVTLVIKLLKDYDLNCAYLVLDMDGGEDLPGDRQKLVKSLGEYAVLDDQGNLVIHREIDDRKLYRRYTLADEPDMSQASSQGSEMGMPDMGGMNGGMGSMDGMGAMDGMGIGGPGGAGRPSRGGRGRRGR